MGCPAALVREEGLEPSRLPAQASKTCVSAIPPFPLAWPSLQRIGERQWVAMHWRDNQVGTPVSSVAGLFGGFPREARVIRASQTVGGLLWVVIFQGGVAVLQNEGFAEECGVGSFLALWGWLSRKASDGRKTVYT